MNTKNQAQQGAYQDEPAVWLRSGPYEAAVLPGIGANLITFKDTSKQYSILREPATIQELKLRPGVYGIPVLFPPNRYEDGKFPWNGKVHQLPINEISTNNHIHGFLTDIPWQVDHYGADEDGSRVTLSVTVNEQHPVFTQFPFHFTIKLCYTLNEIGLSQHVIIHNDGEESMPCLLAFHTAINAPFAANSTEDDYTFKMTIGQRWEVNDRMLPTGQFQKLTADEEKMKSGGLSPFFTAMDNHYTSKPQNGRNRMELTDNRNHVKLVYDAGTAYSHWMIWNNKASGKFFCPEPQINLINAPNVDLPADDIGLVGLAPGEIWEETSRIYLIEE